MFNKDVVWGGIIVSGMIIMTIFILVRLYNKHTCITELGNPIVSNVSCNIK